MSYKIVNGIPSFVSGDRVVMFQKSSDLRKSPQSFDMQTSQAYMEGADTVKHIGELGFFGQKTTTVRPFTLDILQNRQIIETNSDGIMHYDVPFYSNEQCQVVRDTSQEHPAPGIDGGQFKLVLSQEFRPGDILTSDILHGQQVIIANETVLQKADGFEHIAQLATSNRGEFLEPHNLTEGTKFVKLFNSLGSEREGFYSGVSMPNKTSKLTCEFKIGNGSGVSMEVSALANEGQRIGTTFKDGFIRELNMDFESFSKKFGDVGVIMDIKDGEILKETARLTDMAEWFVKREHLHMVENRNMFANRASIQIGSGTVEIAEGLWPQMRRGKIIPYARIGGITRAKLKEAVEYVFQGNDIQAEHRYIKFKAGKFAYENIQELYSKEFSDQQGRLSNVTNLLGNDGWLPENHISSKLDEFGNISLTTKAVKIERVYLPGIGNVEVEHDTSLDYMGSQGTDRLANGMHPTGRTKAAYSMVIWDARNQTYSNNQYTPKGVDYIEDAPQNASVYLVKKPGEMIFSGSTNGRYSADRASDIIASSKQRFTDRWSWDMGSGYFLADPSSVVILELDNPDAKGFN